MTTRFIDRRTDTPSTSEDERLAAESERMRKRRDVREQAARRDLELQPALLAEADIEASEQRCDELAERHAMECQPWQTELRELEAKAISRIGKREPPDTEEDERRVELARLIADATRELEEAVNKEHELQGELRRKARKIREGRPPSYTILEALARVPLVAPKLAIRSHICDQRIRWAKARATEAARHINIQTHNVRGIRAGEISGDLVVFETKLASWQAELEAAEDEQAAALAESDALHQAKLDE